MFNAEKAVTGVVKWIRDYFANSNATTAIVGISGGKDSSVVAALCAEALGTDNVFGVLMPHGEQSDIGYSYDLVEHLGICHATINIDTIPNQIVDAMIGNQINPSLQTKINLPARIRMATLFAVAQSVNGRVANTCNLSEDYVGYATLFGDSAGHFSPISQFTVSEVRAMGRVLELPDYLVDKTPTDGLCGLTDEESLGFTYDTLDQYIRFGECEDEEIQKKIEDLHIQNRFKLEMIQLPSYMPSADMFL